MVTSDGKEVVSRGVGQLRTPESFLSDVKKLAEDENFNSVKPLKPIVSINTYTGQWNM